uniref:Membrane protein, palmitoylated 3a (MAGUK p55 subfamily member 3) n=1 Tax=Cyprinus carpio TaxID=7962 RepID=A0A8C1K8V6_CYPCA
MPVLSAGEGLHETLALLTSQLRPDANHKEDMVFLKDVFSERSLSYLMKIHEKLRQYERQSPTPVLHSASTLAEDVSAAVCHITSPQLLSLLPPLSVGLVHVGDELREVNGSSVMHKRPDEISQLLSQSQGSITLKIIPAIKEEDKLKESKVFMRALFDYTPLEDKATPCQEAGLPFKRGDILQVVSQHDQTWWQAKRVGDCNLRAGLVPSKQFQESPPSSLLVSSAHPSLPACLPTEDCDCEGYFNGQYIAGLRRSFRLSRKDRRGSSGEANVSDQNDTEFLTYEEVTRYQQKPNERPRLVVLIGSLGARINELKQKVIAENPHRYAVAVPHTTRPKKSHEKEGVEYHFVTKQAFDADAQNNKFIEYGEYKENLYGTSIEAIRSVQAKNKMCLVDVQPEALKALRTAEFKPYVIFVKPRLPESRRRRSAATSPGGGEHGRITEEDLQEMRLSAQQIDQQYGHQVDRVLIKEDNASACAELRSILERLERETFWVPVSWVKA